MDRRWFRTAFAIASLSAVALTAGCATAPPTQQGATEDTNNDPYESVNRSIWAFDITLDTYLLKPIAQGYRDYTPQFTQTALNNVLTNMKGPVIFANDLLQGNVHRAGETLGRLSLNTVLGLGGIIDVGAKQGIPFHEADFGQTLGVWGLQSGPYIVLPLLGPSDPRDAIGYGIDSFADPFSIEMRAHNMEIGSYVRTAADIINDRAKTIDDLNEVQKSSLDFYAAVRSLYQQQRNAAVSAGISGGIAQTPSVPGEVEPTSPVPSKPPAPTTPTPSKPPAS